MCYSATSVPRSSNLSQSITTMASASICILVSSPLSVKGCSDQPGSHSIFPNLINQSFNVEPFFCRCQQGLWGTLGWKCPALAGLVIHLDESRPTLPIMLVIYSGYVRFLLLLIIITPKAYFNIVVIYSC